MKPIAVCGIVVPLLGAVLAIGGCAPRPEVRPAGTISPDEERTDVSYRMECDSVSGNSICVMTGNALMPLKPRYPMLSLGAMKKEGGGDAPRYFLRAVYINLGTWLHIGTGPSLSLRLDGETLELAGDGSLESRVQGESGKVFEVALFEVPPSLITRIAASREVTVRLRGDFVLEKSLNSSNRVYFHMFERKYMTAGKTP